MPFIIVLFSRATIPLHFFLSCQEIRQKLKPIIITPPSYIFHFTSPHASHEISDFIILPMGSDALSISLP